MLTVFGLYFSLYCCYGFVRYRNGMGYPQCTSVPRCGYSFFQVYKNWKQINALREVCRTTVARQPIADSLGRRPKIVVVIGESYSVYHSGLYGYEKNTTPLLSAKQRKGELLVFDNAVSLFDFTHAVMRTVYSVGSYSKGDFQTTPLFPACFKNAGYKTALYDNQYFEGQGIYFLSDVRLSRQLFDYRNPYRFALDGEMTARICPEDYSLYVVHLWGQHYKYTERYPTSFSHFLAADYGTSKPLRQREVLASYDNATLYNDRVVNDLMEKFRKEYCCLFYFSDHGEEIYDFRDFMGHCSASTSPHSKYQLRVPFVVWMSPSFRKANPDLWQRMEKARHYPITTDDVAQVLLDVARIQTPYNEPGRSFIHAGYDTVRHRVVLNSVDYDVLGAGKH